MAEGEITITPTTEHTVLWVHDKQRDPRRTKVTMERWLERAAARKHRHINVPSLVVVLDRDMAQMRTFVRAYADSFPDTMPDWLRTTVVKRGVNSWLKQ